MFDSRDTRRVLKHLPTSYKSSSLCADLVKAVIAGEGDGKHWKASALIDDMASRFSCPMRRSLWNVYHQLVELYAFQRHQVGDKEKTGAPFEYASPATLRRHQTKTKKRIEFESKSELVLPGGVAPNGEVFSDTKLPLSVACRTPERRFAEMYTVVVGMEKYANSMDWEPYFWTFTAPGLYHSNPSNKSRSYGGLTPLQANDWLSNRLAKVRALLSKHDLPLLGLRVVETHKDGCPHWHALLFYPPELALRFENIIRSHFERADCTKNEKEEITCVPRQKNRSIATYVFKYLQKNSDGSAEANAVTAQLSLWGIRQYAFFGSININLWRKLRSAANFNEISNKYPDGENVSAAARLVAMWRCARRGDFHGYMSLNGGVRKSPFRVTADLNQPQFPSLGLIKQDSVPWPIRFVSPRPCSVVPQQRLPVGVVGWEIRAQRLSDSTLDLSFIPEEDQKQKPYMDQIVTLIPNGSRSSKTTPYYTSTSGSPSHTFEPPPTANSSIAQRICKLVFLVAVSIGLLVQSPVTSSILKNASAPRDLHAAASQFDIVTKRIYQHSGENK